jgi:precorrin isomerase
MMFDLAQTLTGETPPYATLMYVWDATAPIGTVVTNGRSDRIRKIVIESGPARLRHWRHYERDAQADFLAAFGEAPGALIGVAFMTDADNTQSQAEACYGPPVVR